MKDDKDFDPFKPLSAKYTPVRCRIAPGVQEPLTDGQVATQTSASAAWRLKHKRKRKAGPK